MCLTFRLLSEHHHKCRGKDGILRDMTICSGYHTSLCWREESALPVLSSLLWLHAPCYREIPISPLNPAGNTRKVSEQVSKQEEGQHSVSTAKGSSIRNWIWRPFLDIIVQTAGPQMRTWLKKKKVQAHKCPLQQVPTPR